MAMWQSYENLKHPYFVYKQKYRNFLLENLMGLYKKLNRSCELYAQPILVPRKDDIALHKINFFQKLKTSKINRRINMTSD